MKKIYSLPTTKVVKIQAAKMVAQSIDLKQDGGNGTVLGREDNSWDIWGTNADDEEVVDEEW